MAEFARGDKRI